MKFLALNPHRDIREMSNVQSQSISPPLAATATRWVGLGGIGWGLSERNTTLPFVHAHNQSHLAYTIESGQSTEVPKKRSRGGEGKKGRETDES